MVNQVASRPQEADIIKELASIEKNTEDRISFWTIKEHPKFITRVILLFILS